MKLIIIAEFSRIIPPCSALKRLQYIMLLPVKAECGMTMLKA
jgi:hypothetical protein